MQFLRPRLHLLEQPDVVDGDHGLIGKRRDQIDLALREGPHLVRTRR